MRPQLPSIRAGLAGKSTDICKVQFSRCYISTNWEDLCCFLFIIKMTSIWFFFMKIYFPILFPWVCTFVILWKCWTAREFYIKQWYIVPQTISMYLVVITKLVPDTYIFWDRFDFFPLGKINVLIGMPIHATTHYQYQYKFLSSIHHCRKE